MRNALMLHTGGKAYSRDQIAEVVTPAASDTHVPIPHIDFLERTEDALVERGYEIVGEQHALNRGGHHYFGMIEVRNEIISPDYGIMIGLRNAHDKTFSASLVLGSRVFVCDNLAFSGEVRLARSHTKYIMRDIPTVIARAVGQLAENRVKQDRRISAYKQSELTDTQADHLMVQMIRERIMLPSKMGEVVKEWDSPRHPEFAQDGKTIWRLFNAATEVMKGNVMALPRRTTALHGLMDGAVEDAVWEEVKEAA